MYIFIYIYFLYFFTFCICTHWQDTKKQHNWNFSVTDVRSSAATATPEAPPVPPVTGPVVTAVLLEDGCSSNGKHGKGRNHP